MSQVLNGCVGRIHERWADLVHWRPQLDDFDQLARNADTMASAGFGGGRVWGSVDGTFMQFCRPEDNDMQRRTYSGYYGANGIKFQAITTSDGLISHASESFLGAYNDWSIWTHSGFQYKLRPTFRDRPALYVFGDNAYRDCYGIIPPWQDGRGFRWLSEDQLCDDLDRVKYRLAILPEFSVKFLL